MNNALVEKTKELPHRPGVYIYKNSDDEVIYVGKAKDLKNRVGSYFMENLDPSSKTFALVSKIDSFSIIEVTSEFEALLLETSLIKKYRPKYNIIMKDDKSYLYIVIRNEKVSYENDVAVVPKIATERESNIQKKDKVYGPYPDSSTAKYILRTLRKIIPFRDCNITKFNRYKYLGRPCLYGHMGLCSAPCIHKDYLAEYKKGINRIRKILSGESRKLVQNFKKEMDKNAKLFNFEEAARYRDLLNRFAYITQGFKTAQTYLENPYFTDDIANKALDDLSVLIPNLKPPLSRIECYDISNISGKDAVGSMVVATKGKIDKSQYRRFRIKFKDTPDDFGMLSEVLKRRLNRSLNESVKNKWTLPDLIILDGGKGQVSAGLEILKEANLNLPVVGIAKKFETVVYIKDGKFQEVIPGKESEGLKLIQRLRDEAHRFAQSYHHKLRLKIISR